MIMIICLVGCSNNSSNNSGTEKVKGSKTFESTYCKPTMEVTLETDKNTLTKVKQETVCKEVILEDAYKMTENYTYDKKYAEEKFVDGKKVKREGIYWQLIIEMVDGKDTAVVKETIDLDLTNITEEDKKELEKDLKYYDFNDFEKTKKNLEERGIQFEK